MAGFKDDFSNQLKFLAYMKQKIALLDAIFWNLLGRKDSDLRMPRRGGVPYPFHIVHKVGEEGFGPSHGGFKGPCLTTWLLPNFECNLFNFQILYLAFFLDLPSVILDIFPFALLRFCSDILLYKLQ